MLDTAAPLQTMIDKLGKLPLLAQPGTRWSYSIAVDVQGYLVEKFSGMKFDEFLRTKLFEPLGMTTTTFDFAKALKGDVAQPHGDDVDGKVVRAPMDLNYSIVPVRPAGGVWTSPRELAKYVEMELAKGMLPNGRRFVSQENLSARYKPNVIVGENVASRRIADTCGFTLEGTARGAFFNDGRNQDVLLYSLLRTDPRPWHAAVELH